MTQNNQYVLDVVYKPSANIKYERNADGIIIILEKQDHKIQQIFRKLKFRIPEYKKIMLDDYGSWVFSLLDGKRSVRNIGESLAEKYGEEVEPLYERLLIYLNHIEKKRCYIEKI